MRISDWSLDVCSSDLEGGAGNLIGRRRTEDGNGLAQLLRRHEGSRRLLLAQERRCRFLLADPLAGRDVADLLLDQERAHPAGADGVRGDAADRKSTRLNSSH